MNWYEKNKISDLPIWDSVNGIGAVPHNQEIDYRGFVKMMTPSEFRALVPSGSWSNSGESMATDAKNKGIAFGPPFLLVRWNESKKVWKVIDHEGRSRSDASEILAPGKPMPVHILPLDGLRARDITEEMKSAPFIKQK